MDLICAMVAKTQSDNVNANLKEYEDNFGELARHIMLLNECIKSSMKLGKYFTGVSIERHLYNREREERLIDYFQTYLGYRVDSRVYHNFWAFQVFWDRKGIGA